MPSQNINPMGEKLEKIIKARKYFAYGDNARAMIAIGFTKTSGTFYESLGNLSSHDITEVKDCLDLVVPNYFNFIKEIIKFFLR